MENAFEVSPDISLKKYFTEIVPEQFKRIMNKRVPRKLAGTELSMQFDVEGPNGGAWSVIVTDGKSMSVIEGSCEEAMTTSKLSEEYIRDSFRGIVPPLMEFERLFEKEAPENLQAIKNLRGKLTARLKMPEGNIHTSEVIFNKTETPEVTIKISIEDVWEMRKKNLDGRTAFMENRIEVEGDILFALKLSRFEF